MTVVKPESGIIRSEAYDRVASVRHLNAVFYRSIYSHAVYEVLKSDAELIIQPLNLFNNKTENSYISITLLNNPRFCTFIQPFHPHDSECVSVQMEGMICIKRVPSKQVNVD